MVPLTILPVTVGEARLKVHSWAGRGMAAAGLGMLICILTTACAGISHGMSCSLRLNP